MEYKSNIDKILGPLKTKLTARNIQLMNKEIAQSIFASNLRRIHNDGKAVNGKSIGNYRPSTKRYRIKHNREVAYVDLEVNGRLRLSWKMLPNGRNGYVIGFENKYGSDISGYMEDHFKKKIWGVSDEDKKVSERIIKRYFANA